MSAGHAATPNSEVSATVTPGSQNSTTTVPSQIGRGENGATPSPDASEVTKIVKASPGV